MRPDTGPAARALITMEAIQDAPGISAQRLAQRLGVSTRAVRRYVGILREAEIPVESLRGPAGGYRLGRGTRLPPLVFSSAEALGLVMAVLDGHHPTADADDPVAVAVAKLLRAMPQHVADQADVVRRTTAAAPDRGAARPDPSTTVALVRARSERRCVAVQYRSESGREFTTQLEPWAVVVRHGRWYLLCRTLGEATVRTYRVDRIRGVRELAIPFDPPDGLDPVAALEEHLAVGWEYPTEVVIAAPRAELGGLPRTLGRLEEVDEHSTRLVGTTSNLHDYACALATLRAPWTVVRGPELRAAVADLSRRLAAAST
ncbi:WYL domain-containing protein [Phycicoccus endophyticus]|uniref:WYL domain-containing protein n=1 Tax=Phycicoccus endophyticus TaxID=1690220 RepID=A0A7G9R162_9MICO|nr:WYL domain-containing protein [Phycicoccus endophyticus]NHI20531.1 WYL domain-containing protein [Phycicoccus endophyticus]QNN49337.1 WYL domain-containing protein [Phycicoccus endophyticus]GGL45278.1 transcriptional regulator [Phycicoccus endophyticus]